MSTLSRFCFAAVILTCAASCLKKQLPSGIATTVTGIVHDPNSQQPVSGVKILIKEFTPNFMSRKYIGDVDSTTTGNDGSFSIRFETTGNGRFYDVVLDDERFADYRRAELRPGFDTTIRFETRKFSWLRADIEVSGNSRPPLRIIAPYGRAEVWTATTDTFYYTRVLPNQAAGFEFAVGPNMGEVTHSQRDTVILTGFNDTFYHNFRLTPDQFKPR